MIVIACLGNPGRKYKKTRHNIGFIAGDYLRGCWSIKLSKKFDSAETGAGRIQGLEVRLLFPQTYMNNSGMAVKRALDFHKGDSTQLIVIHDEIELAFGDIRHKFGGGHKGHNGLRSIIQHCGSPDFHRIRFGVGRPDNPHITVADYVLSKFTKDEFKSLEQLLPEVENMIVSIIKEIG